MHKKINKNVVIFLVENDFSQRESIQSFLEFQGYDVQSFITAEEFLDLPHFPRPSVLISDIRLPFSSGIELYNEITKQGLNIPVIFISGESSIQQTVDAMKQGAIEFLVKPFDISDLINAIEKAANIEIRKLHQIALIKKLSPRENQVYELLLQGLNNSELMEKLNISLPTVKQYKSEVMRKLEAKSLSEIIRLSN